MERRPSTTVCTLVGRKAQKYLALYRVFQDKKRIFAPTKLLSVVKRLFQRIRAWLQTLSYRTGVVVLLCCIPFYILSFAQMLLPISAGAKTVLWTVLFGLAKTCQYSGLTILGVEGYKRLKSFFKRRRRSAEEGESQ